MPASALAIMPSGLAHSEVPAACDSRSRRVQWFPVLCGPRTAVRTSQWRRPLRGLQISKQVAISGKDEHLEICTAS